MDATTQAMTLLLVEDSRADARLIEILLADTSTNIKIKHVSSMRAAVRAIVDDTYDITLLDLGLPDGFGLDNVVRIHTFAPTLPIIVMTGLDDAQTAEGARKHGASGYLVKGSVTTGAELLQHIQQALVQARATNNTLENEQERRGGIETDLGGEIISWGRDACAITGYSTEEMLGQRISKLIPESRQDEIALIDGRIRRGESLREFETLRLHRSGETREVSLYVSPRHNAQGDVIGTRTSIRDITELKRNRADALQLSAIVASTDDAIIATTLDGIVTHWNPGAQSTLGYSSDDMLGRAFFQIMPAQFVRRANTMLDAVRRGKTVPRVDAQLLHKQGHPIDVSISLSPIRDSNGGLLGAAILAADITDRKQAQLALEAANAEQAAANKELRETLAQLRKAQDQLVQAEKFASLGGLVAGVAHEINTPVGVGVTAASHLRRKLEEMQDTLASGSLKRSQLDEFVSQADQATHIILANLERAAKLIQSFKQVAVDQSSSEYRKFNLHQYLHEVLLSLRPKLKPTGVQVDVTCDPALTLNSLPGAYSQIVTNLVVNSLIHAYDTGDTGSIKITAQTTGQNLRLNYSDDGRGMTPEIKAQVFDPFFTTRRGQGGSGLGMNVVYNLITQKLGGTLELHSSPGRGMQLEMTLPLHRPKQPA